MEIVKRYRMKFPRLPPEARKLDFEEQLEAEGVSSGGYKPSFV